MFGIERHCPCLHQNAAMSRWSDVYGTAAICVCMRMIAAMRHAWPDGAPGRFATLALPHTKLFVEFSLLVSIFSLHQNQADQRFLVQRFKHFMIHPELESAPASLVKIDFRCRERLVLPADG